MSEALQGFQEALALVEQGRENSERSQVLAVEHERKACALLCLELALAVSLSPNPTDAVEALQLAAQRIQERQ